MSVFADPETVTYAALLAAFTGRDDAPASIAVTYPATALTGDSYALQVDMEGDNADDYPVTARASVRVTVHAPKGKRTLVKDAANVARSLIASASADGVAGFHPSGRSAVSQDPDTGNLMCWFLVRADLLAQLLAS